MPGEPRHHVWELCGPHSVATRPASRQYEELRRGREAFVPAVWPSRRLPQASDLLDSVVVPHRTRVIGRCRQVGHHIPPVPPPAVVDCTQNVKRRQRSVDEACQGVQLRRFAAHRSRQRFVRVPKRHVLQDCNCKATGPNCGRHRRRSRPVPGVWVVGVPARDGNSFSGRG